MKDQIVDEVFNRFIDFDIFFIFMTVVPPSDHLSVIFVFDDAAFSHRRSGSISCYIIDTFIYIVIIIVFFSLFCIDIETLIKLPIAFVSDIIETFQFLSGKKIKDLIHPCLSELFIGNERKVLYFICLSIISFFTYKTVDMRIPFQIPSKGM